MNQMANDDLLKKWNLGWSLNEIAKKSEKSVCFVRNYLLKQGVQESEFHHSSGATRHYNTEADIVWNDIHEDVLNGMSLTNIYKKYHITRKRLFALFDRHDFDYDACLQQLDIEYGQNLKLCKASKMSVKEMANFFQKSERTISRDLNRFGLTQKADRIDISDESILADCADGYSINQIALKYQCSHDTITKRLNKYGIVYDRPTGIERHFDMIHDKDWFDIKADLDLCLPVSIVAIKYGLRYEAVYRMMERHEYVYNGLQQLDMDLWNKRISHVVDEKEHMYLTAVKNYWEQHGNLPVIYTLSKYLSTSMREIREMITRYELYDFIGNNGPSVKVLRILHDLDELGIVYQENNRPLLTTDDGRRFELDVYLPDYKIGIEINPTWTHSPDVSTSHVGKMYHHDKSLLAESKQIGLIHMYDVDFYDERRYQVFLTQIKAIVDSKVFVGARQCTVKMIDRIILNQFLDTYHFQGGEHNSQYLYGLFYHDVLLGVLSIGVSRYTKDTYEIIRYCMNPNYIVHGSFQKLFQTFLKTLSCDSTIVSYMDLNKRLRSKNVYEMNGFSFDGCTPPDYMWYNRSGTKWKSRYQTTKKQLVAQGFDEKKSESVIMLENDYYRVYGAGAKRYVYHYHV